MKSARAALHQAIASGGTLWGSGAFDALSARLIEATGFGALVTSGFGISASLLGQPDAELYTMTENLNVVRNIANAVSIPVAADIDTGYGNAINVMRTIREFEAANVAAVIMEDQVSPKRCPAIAAGVELVPMEEAVAKIRAAVAARGDSDLVIVARTDAPPEEAMVRARAYVAAGADLIQPISKTFKSFEGLRALRAACGVPLSLQLIGWLERDLKPAEVESLAAVAFHPFVPLLTAVTAMRENLSALVGARTSANLPHHAMTYEAFGEFIGFPQIAELEARYLLPTAAK